MNKSLKLFFIVVIILSTISDVMIIRFNLDIFYLILMWSPAIASIVAIIYENILNNKKITFKSIISDMGFRKCSVKYILLGIILPLIYLLIPYMIYWKKYPSNFAYHNVSLGIIFSDCAPIMIIGIFTGLISALGEEIGWRGYMLPRLSQKYGNSKALIISSLFWCLWHFPLIISGNYMSNLPLYYQLPMFILCIFPIGVICGVYALKTKSVWPSAFLHSAHNNYDQMVFQFITRGEIMYYFASEIGIGTAICALIITVIVCIMNKDILI